MKDVFDSKEAFTAHATISAGYYMMSKLQEEMDKLTPKNVIAAMIDDATGYSAERLKSHINNLSVCLIDIIEAKKTIEADYKRDEEMLIKLLEHKNIIDAKL